MATLSKQPFDTRPRTRANRDAGKAWLVVLFFFLTGLNFANSTVEPMLGSLGPLLRAALIISTVWNAVLLACIGFGHIWARFILAAFITSFVIGQILFFINVIVQHPSLRGDPIHMLAIIFAGNLFTVIYLLVSPDIRQLSHHVID